MTHTPTPWKVFRAKNGVYIGVGDAEGQGIMDAGFGLWESGAIRDANAEFVVTAVNAYDKHRALIETLVKALEECAQRNVYDGDYFHDIGLSDRMRASWNAEKQADAALKAAKKEGF